MDQVQFAFWVSMPVLAVLLGIAVNVSQIKKFRAHMNEQFDGLIRHINARFDELDRHTEPRL